MLLYHGSKKLLSRLSPRQAWASEGRPAGESLKAVYLSPSFPFALACAVRPEGVTEIGDDGISFENPASFDPEVEVFVCVVDNTSIKGNVVVVDDNQTAVFEEVFPVRVERHKAGEVFRYYRLVP